MRILASIYNSFLWAMALTITLFGSAWLEMRINMAYILLGCWLLFFVACYLLCRIKKWRVPLLFTGINTVVCATYSAILLGFKRLGVVPASIIREGLHMRRLPFATINCILLAVLLAVFLVLCIGEIHHRKQAPK